MSFMRLNSASFSPMLVLPEAILFVVGGALVLLAAWALPDSPLWFLASTIPTWALFCAATKSPLPALAVLSAASALFAAGDSVAPDVALAALALAAIFLTAKRVYRAGLAPSAPEAD